LSPLVLVGGGARSGKSAFALTRARALGPRRAFIATAQALDEEMRIRIAHHVEERGDTFRTIEAPYDLADAVAALRDVDVVVVDCLTLWLSNLLTRGDEETWIDDAVVELVRALSATSCASIVVTNEVGMGIVPENALARQFRDIVGRAHQSLAQAATEVHVALLGCIVRLRPAPIALHEGR
jgi:adenosylcobinamide kinase / adenosylcobinamide-phosphate guanylyltransferase